MEKAPNFNLKLLVKKNWKESSDFEVRYYGRSYGKEVRGIIFSKETRLSAILGHIHQDLIEAA